MEIVPLANSVPAAGAAEPGWPTNLLYSFTVPGNPEGVEFAVTNTSGSGNVELLVSDGMFPTPEQAYSGSFNAGTIPQIVEFGTNSLLPTLANTTWYLAVPNISIPNAPVNYTITATVIASGAILNPPAITSANISSPTGGVSFSWIATPGESYTVEISTDLINWTVASNIVAQSSTGSYTDSVPANTQTARFYRLTTP
jgi:hypothetical protein